MSLQVVEPGLCSLLVDHGRCHHRSLGVPIGGAADRISLALGNALVGNPPDTVGLEITLAGPLLKAEGRIACVLFGAPFEMTRNQQPLPAGKTFTLETGDELHIQGTPHGMRAYLCVVGGFRTEAVLGSYSALEPLKRGAELRCAPSALPGRFVNVERTWDANDILQRTFGLPSSDLLLRVLPGPQFDWFDAGDRFPVGFDFTLPRLEVSPASNRMGLRLRGEPLPLPDRELLSEPVCPGSVQVTRDGQCIILGVDGQTIGGYPKIAQVISADLDLLGQLRPGNRLQFVQVSLEQAETLYREKQQTLHDLLTRIQAVAHA